MDTNIEIVKKLYSEDMAVQDMETYTDKGFKRWEEAAAALFPPHSYIIDIGCGMGREAFCLYDAGHRVVATDISQRVIDRAKQFAAQTGRDVEFQVTDGLSLPYPDDTFDACIIWAQTFGLFYGDDNKRRMLDECRRVLKKGGFMSFSGHDYEFQKTCIAQYLKGRRFYPYPDTDCYWESFTQDELVRHAQQAGFRNAICQRGLVYGPEDGTILHCTCRK